MIKKPRKSDLALLERMLKRLDDSEKEHHENDLRNGRSLEIPRGCIRAVVRTEAEALRRVLVVIKGETT